MKECPRCGGSCADSSGVCFKCREDQAAARSNLALHERTVEEIDAIMSRAARDKLWSVFEACNDELRSRGVPPAP